MIALKGKTDIGDQINKKIIAPLANENKLSNMPDFNDATKLGSGKEMVDRLTNLIAIFENRSHGRSMSYARNSKNCSTVKRELNIEAKAICWEFMKSRRHSSMVVLPVPTSPVSTMNPLRLCTP